MRTRRVVPVAAVTVLLSLPAFANRSGIYAVASTGCNGCHFGGATPTMTVEFSKTDVMPGETITATVTVSNANDGTGGFLLRASKGSMTNPGAGVKVAGSAATHSTPKAPDGNNAFVFTVDWKAPTTAGAVTFDAYGNATNDDDDEGGDRGVKSSATVNVCGGPFYTDMDGDGFGTGAAITDCQQPADTAVNPGDCDDLDSDINPNASEVCGDAVDDNCNGSLDDGCTGGMDGGTGGTDAGGPADGGVNPVTEPVGCGCAAGAGSSSALISFGIAAFGLFLSRRRRQAQE